MSGTKDERNSRTVTASSPRSLTTSPVTPSGAGEVPPLSPSLVTYNVIYKDSKGQVLLSRPVSEKKFDELKESARGAVLERKKVVRIIDQSKKEPTDASGKIVMNEKASDMEKRVDAIESEQIIIYSSLLIKAVKQAVTYWPSLGFVRAEKNLALDRPYRSIGAYRTNLNNLLEEYESLGGTRGSEGEYNGLSFEDCKKTAKEIKLLTHELDKAQKEIMDEKLKREAETDPVTSFDSLFTLFTPGTIVYHDVGGKETPYQVRICQWSSDPQLKPGDPVTRVSVVLWNLDFNGTHIDRRRHTVPIQRFEGERKVRDLGLYPEVYANNHEQKRAHRVARGKKYFEYLSSPVPCLRYEGYLSDKATEAPDIESQSWYEGRVIIDPRLHAQETGYKVKSSDWETSTESNYVGGSLYDGFVKIDPKKPKSALTDDHYFLLPQYIMGFTLDIRQIRQWVFLDVDCTHELQTGPDLIRSLAIDEKKVELVQALTARRPIGKGRGEGERITFAADNIEGKGAGRIIILHGPPGVGKTYTAECISEWAGRPLLRITCTELGIDPTQLERKLQTSFVRAEKWDAILLIDEADVFLEQRYSEKTLQKEAVTAVFLRALEFYRGILFLTTNRMIEFDDAIQSRASLILGFETLSPSQRKHIRTSMLDKLQATNRYKFLTEAQEEYRDLDDDGEYAWSGRDIITVIQSAVALAEFQTGGNAAKSPELGSQVEINGKNVRDVIAPIRGFAKYRSKRHSEVEKAANDRGAR